MQSCAADLRHPWADAALPPPDLTVSQWAERHAVLAAESSSEPGRWRSIPYQVAMMDACCHPDIERVTIKKSARVGYTKVIGNLIGYHIHQDPCSILVVQPTIDDAKGWSKEELMPTIEQTDVLLGLVAPSRSKSSDSTIQQKHYPGGILHVVGANSARGFRRITVRLVLFDEVDGYPPSAGNEGDQEKLGEMRSETAWNRKIVKGSTPTEEGVSRIGRAWRESSQGHYVLPCPRCGGEHIRRFLQPDKPIMIRGQPFPVSHLDQGTACWVCPACDARLAHKHHREMIEAGRWYGEDWEWRPGSGFTLLPTFAGHIGMHIWAGYGYSPNSTPAKLIMEYQQAQGDPEQLKTFTNTKLGEEWTEPGEQLDHDTLKARAEKYPAEVPDGVIVLTAGVDVQQDRIELEVVGWGVGEESWSVDYQVLVGDPVQDDVWADLLELWRNHTWARSDGSMRLAAMCVDSGYLPKRVYKFVQAAAAQHVYPIKGRAGAYPVIEQKTARDRRRALRKKAGAAPEMLGVDEAKAITMRRLRLVRPGPGYCHTPVDRDEEWYRQLTGERQVTRYPRGKPPVREWIKIHGAVEALDCRVYAYAALLLSGQRLERPPEPPPAAPEKPAAAPAVRRTLPPRRLIR